MPRRLLGSLALALALALAACGSVNKQSTDAGPRDSPPTIDGRGPDSPPGPTSIVSVHHVIEMQPADQVIPTSVAFTTTSGRALILVAGSGQCASGFQIGMTVKLDGTAIGTAHGATNELNSSKAFVRNAILVDLIAGNHSLSITPATGTTMGATEFVDATVIELGGNSSATTIFNDVAPPYSGTFIAGGNHGVLLAGGSGYVGNAAAVIGMDVRVDNQSVGLMKTFTNEIASHKAFGADQIVLTPTTGSRTLDLVALSGTNVDYNDHGSATWLELGSDATPTLVVDHVGGALPLSNPIVTSGHQILLLVSGSGFGTAANMVIGVDVALDSVAIGSAKVTTTETYSHKTFVPTVLLAQPAAGSHTLTLSASTGTATDFNDSFNVTMIEL